MSEALRDRRALITGAASGIGRALARRAAELGASVVAADVNEQGVRALADEIGGRGVALDVGDPEAWRRVASETGPWDLVALNAGIMSAGPDAPLEASDLLTLDLERYRAVLRVNVDGVVLGLRTAMPMMEGRGGAIVATASAAGLIGYPLDPTYTLTKHAVVGLVRSMAGVVDMRRAAGAEPGPRVCAICPGGVLTGLMPVALRSVPQIMEPEVIADEIVDLWLHGENGEIRARIREDEPAWKVELPPVALY